jgi:hypothetical protein
MRKSVSLIELSIHDRFIWLLDTGMAVKFEGAAGADGSTTNVVAVAMFE